jgi:MFS family permease
MTARRVCGVSPERQGLAFGAKYAAIPTASLAAGLALAAVALVADWRTGALGAAVVVAAAVVLRPEVAAAARTMPGHRSRSRPTLLLVAIGATGLLAGGVGNALPAFTVDSAVSRGIGEHEAALILAMGSAAALIMRVAGGWIADRRRSVGLSELTALTAVGAVSFAVLVASGGSDTLFVLGVVVTFAAAWGWPGLIHFATARTHRSSQGPATGFVLSCVYAGNVLGPGAVGFIVEHGSYGQAWVFSALVLGLATLAGLGARRLARGHEAV